MSNTKLKTAKLQIESSRKIVEGSLRLTTGLCAGVALEFLPPVTATRLLIKINIKNKCLARLVPPEQKPGYAELMIATTSSQPCSKPNVACWLWSATIACSFLSNLKFVATIYFLYNFIVIGQIVHILCLTFYVKVFFFLIYKTHH